MDVSDTKSQAAGAEVSDRAAGSYIMGQIERRFTVERRSLKPALPEKIAIEINNSCNHKCYFCPNPTMTRPRRVMDDALVLRILRDAYDSGIRQVSFFSTGEPLLNRRLPGYVRTAKEMGYAYTYLSTNGGKAVSARIPEVLEAGLDSLKFSINAGTRQSYLVIHGFDEFDHVLSNLARVAAYRKSTRPGLRLSISYVETPINAGELDVLRGLVTDLVDEVVPYPFVVMGTPLKQRVEKDGSVRPYIGFDAVDRTVALNQQRLSLPCFQPWSYLNVTAEGYLSACCSDFNNDLVVGNLNDQSLLEAWHSLEFQELRLRHLRSNVKGTLCDGCIAQRDLPFEPLNPHLKTNEAPNRIGVQSVVAG
jgi:MoaA/NifB/PqqE/SkfB family radical SAM enzyme